MHAYSQESASLVLSHAHAKREARKFTDTNPAPKMALVISTQPVLMRMRDSREGVGGG
jgi:hypothetical protein